MDDPWAGLAGAATAAAAVAAYAATARLSPPARAQHESLQGRAAEEAFNPGL